MDLEQTFDCIPYKITTSNATPPYGYDLVVNDNPLTPHDHSRYMVTLTTDKLQKKHLRWYIIYADENSQVKIGPYTQFDGKRLKGQSEQWWLDTLGDVLSPYQLHPTKPYDRE